MNHIDRIIAISKLCRYNVNGECAKACLNFLHLFDEPISTEIIIDADCNPFSCPELKEE